MITNVEENTLQKQEVFYAKGTFPKVMVLAEKVRNKKQTQITGLEPFKIDLSFFELYVKKRCSASVSVHELETTKKGAFYVIKIQGN